MIRGVMWILAFTPVAVLASDIALNDEPVEPSASTALWGYRPTDGCVSHVNPPGFCWRPQGGIESWEMECRTGGEQGAPAYSAQGIEFNVHCPDRVFPPGTYAWRYRGFDKDGRATNFSHWREFTVLEDSAALPMPSRQDLSGRIPTAHPRLFLRPEDLPRLRELARGTLSDRYKKLVATCERLLKNPPPTAEPPKYPEGMVRGSDAWREIWWGNRNYTKAALNGAATLAFTRLLDGNEEYGQLARHILLDCARWDPKGSTGFRYNDEAGMPYAYYFARTYTFVYDLLSDEERATCRRVMEIRGDEMHRHLCPRHLWRPYSSHSNRAWHFLGEVAIAFHGEIEAADDWLWFAMNVFYNTYPVWCDDDGGWHEGNGYWSSYIGRFTWWADVMRSAVRIDAYHKPYFSQVGYYPMYFMPPGKVGGGFGDLNAKRKSRHNATLVTQLAAQAGNGHWQWYVEQLGGPRPESGYVGFMRGALPMVEPVAPTDLPASRLFRGTGQAVFNTDLADAANGVQVVFKSSPFGTQSHGYEANNSFLLWAYGQRLLIRSGYRDSYGSQHHRHWMWTTRSTNSITVDGQGQLKHSAASQGRITAFQTTPRIDVVVGEAGEAYRPGTDLDKGRLLDRFTRAIVFVKPELVVVYDRLSARQESTFEYWLHAPESFEVKSPTDIRLKVGDAGCAIAFLAPEGLNFSQTDQYDPNPRPRIKLREWHLTAATPRKTRECEFVAVYRPYCGGSSPPTAQKLVPTADGYELTAELSDAGTALVRLPKGVGAIEVECRAADGKVAACIQVDEE